MDKELKEVVTELVIAQRQTTQNVNELRHEFKTMIKVITDVKVMENKLSSIQHRVDDLEKDIEKLESLREGDRKLLVTTLISALGAVVAAVFGLMKGS